jgi:hypothetical protein
METGVAGSALLVLGLLVVTLTRYQARHAK